MSLERTGVVALPAEREPGFDHADTWLGNAGTRMCIAVGDPGTVTVVDTAGLALVETVATDPGTDTLGRDPISRILYVFCPAISGAALFTHQDHGS